MRGGISEKDGTNPDEVVKRQKPRKEQRQAGRQAGRTSKTTCRGGSGGEESKAVGEKLPTRIAWRTQCAPALQLRRPARPAA